MKKLLVFLCVIAIVSCKEEPKDYVTLSGKITNKKSDSLLLRSRMVTKTIQLNSDGTFSDTLKIGQPEVFGFFNGDVAAPIFLKNGFDIEMTADMDDLEETVKFSGSGSEHNNYLTQQMQLEKKLLDQDRLSSLSSEGLKTEMESIRKELTTFYNHDKNIDSTLTNMAKANLEPMLNMYQNYFAESIAIREQFPAGSPSPTFENYENHKGGTTSLEDLKGKYVYVDVWATWCGPCIAEIPSLKELDAKYADKNIQFVSISIDDAMRSGGGDLEVAKNKWRTMVEEENLIGLQLFSDKNWQSDFVRDYKINGIPRFILIDPNGNVVDANAPRPSSKKLIELFDSLNI
ncbi:TlpA disulfide reductase family protein [Gelidibacter maritimus]|uniref:TlpA family protein disulfide reductase n=1 Tax=Gelidibacter maritimus TaxID=2761487 RepID=A0A7W2R427_9FLAO|nr:TlpA disulfide reductase family protein [Gelidibacter maritimus]MBA6152620.1 TlpA family protein disulfide reductase [Gelidibacter maritimus]